MVLAQAAQRASGERRRPRALLADTRGAAAIEFALCASAFFGLLIASLQVALAYFAQQGIQTSAEIMARKIMTGQVAEANQTKSQFMSDACASLRASMLFMKCANLAVDVRAVNKFSDTDLSLPALTYDSDGNVTGGTQYNPGAGGDIVVLRLLYNWPVSPGPLNFDISNTSSNGRRLMVGSMVFKSEDY